MVGSTRDNRFGHCWNDFYRGRKFVHLLQEGEFPDVSHVVGTNRIDLSVSHDSRTGRFIICSAEDNLLKGAGGQASTGNEYMPRLRRRRGSAMKFYENGDALTDPVGFFLFGNSLRCQRG